MATYKVRNKMILLQIIIAALSFSQGAAAGSNSSKNSQPCAERMEQVYVNGNELFCECQSAYVYYPEDDSCYDAYRQGPCLSGQYLVLPPGEDIARCVENPCLIDGIVPFHGKCHFVWKTGPPCGSDKAYLAVEGPDFELKCDADTYYKGRYDNMFISKSCPEHTIFRQLDKGTASFACDCEFGYLYYSKTNSCHLNHRQGPCPPEHYFVLPQGEIEARCEKNPCSVDGFVLFKGGCFKLGEKGPPCEESSYLVMNNNNQAECYTFSGGYGGGGIITAAPKACPKGSRRIATGSCKHVFE